MPSATARLHALERLEVDVDGARTDGPRLVGREQPDLLLVNDDDLAYAKIRLDERSLATALSHPRGFTASLPRSLVLGATWDMTRDAEMGARTSCVVLETLPGETDSTLLRILIGQVVTAVRPYTAPEHRAETLTCSPAPALGCSARAAEPGSDAQFQLVQPWCQPTPRRDDTASPALPALRPRCLDGLTVDTELSWTFVKALAAPAPPRIHELQAELEREHTSTAGSAPPRPSPPARPPRPRRRPGPRPSRAAGCPTPWSTRSPTGFTRPGTPPVLLSPTWRSTTRCSSTPRGAAPRAR